MRVAFGPIPFKDNRIFQRVEPVPIPGFHNRHGSRNESGLIVKIRFASIDVDFHKTFFTQKPVITVAMGVLRAKTPFPDFDAVESNPIV